MPNPHIAVVTGGGGYLGRRLVEQLLEDPPHPPLGRRDIPTEIRVLDRDIARVPASARVVAMQGDIRSPQDLDRAFAGASVVYHMAALVDWGRVPMPVIRDVNVVGTERVIDACRRCGVPALVYTSTMDAIDSGDPVLGGDETLPYPPVFANEYCETKAEAEQRAIAAHGRSLLQPGPDGQQALAVAVIRPCSMYGEGDPFHIGIFAGLGRTGELIKVDDGSTRSQMAYVGNVAHGHRLAARALLDPTKGQAAGEVFIITDHPAFNFYEGLRPYVEAAGGHMPRWSLPRGPMLALGTVLERAAKTLAPVIHFQPMFTRFAINHVSRNFVVETEKASRLLGYEPRHSWADAHERTLRWWTATQEPPASWRLSLMKTVDRIGGMWVRDDPKAPPYLGRTQRDSSMRIDRGQSALGFARRLVPAPAKHLGGGCGQEPCGAAAVREPIRQ